MRVRIASMLTILVLMATPVWADEEAPNSRDEEAQKDLSQLQGTWQLQSLENGNKETIKVGKRTLFIGGELYVSRHGDRIVQTGLLRLMTNRTPRRIDVVIRKGQYEDNTMLGIYEIKNDTLKVCFDPEGESRPVSFKPQENSPQFVAVYKRVKPAVPEEVDIVGKYRSESIGADGKKQVMAAEVLRRGDAYMVRWMVPGGLAYIGMGIRQGNTLSVAWVNRGSFGLSVYQITKGPKLTGQYTEVGGPGLIATESLTSTGEGGWVEVRQR